MPIHWTQHEQVGAKMEPENQLLSSRGDIGKGKEALLPDLLQVDAQGARQVPAQSAGRLGRDWLASRVSVRDLNGAGNQYAGLLRGPHLERFQRARVCRGIPGRPKRQVVAAAVDQGTGLDRFEDLRELLDPAPDFLVAAADELDVFMVVVAILAANVRTVHVESEFQPAFRPAWDKVAQSPNGGVNAVAGIIAVVVVRTTVLALIPVFDSVLVHKGNNEKLDVLAEPAAIPCGAKNRFKDAFEAIAGEAFAGVVARSEQHTQWGLAVESAESEFFYATSHLAFCQHARLERRIAAMALKEGVQVRLEIRDCDREADLVDAERNAVAKARSLDSFGAKPAPAAAVVRAYGRAAHANDIAIRELDIESFSGRAAYTEGPVEPWALRIAQVLMDSNSVTLDGVDDDVAAGDACIDQDGGDADGGEHGE